MIDYEQYPADFGAEQERALDALAEIYNADDISDIPEEDLEAVRARSFTLLANVFTVKDLGYAYADETGLEESLYYLFDWERYGQAIQDENGGEFTNAGWIRLD